MEETNLLLLPQSEKTDTGDLHNLEPHTGNITLCFSATTETGDEDFVVLIDKVEATVILPVTLVLAHNGFQRGKRTHGDESSDLFAVLDQLHTNTLADSRVGLLGFYTNFLQNDSLGMGRTSRRRGLVDVTERTLLVAFIGLFTVQSTSSRERK
jgi:hypothetical protein